ncbi:type II toxin-antitoxin system VapC family toxin [bacterium]|nr:type II toxin-antitoxin system VapC family toxin [bacterium]
MNVVLDSSVWIEILLGSKTGEKAKHYLKTPKNLYVPSLVLYEVYKKIKKTLDEEKAFYAVSLMKKGSVVDLNEGLAIEAADLALKYDLAMADAIVYGTAQVSEARLVTADYDFHGLPNVDILK